MAQETTWRTIAGLNHKKSTNDPAVAILLPAAGIIKGGKSLESGVGVQRLSAKCLHHPA